MESHAFEIRSLSHSYAGTTVLDIESLTIRAASIVGLFGPNGSGKSTLLRLLGLIDEPSSGEILFEGNPVEPFSQQARFLITLLPQEPFLMRRSVFENVAYGIRLRGGSADLQKTVDEALSLVGLDADSFCRRPWYALSAGETQRVALAARLALKPRVLLLDEPTAGVDAASAHMIKEATLRAREELGTTLVIASHDWQWLGEICDEAHHLFRGRIFGTGRETIVFGPFIELEADRWFKQLSDDQQLQVPAPPSREAAAVFTAMSLAEHGNDVNLTGTVSRLSLERRTGNIFATILVGDLPFAVRLTPEQNEAHTVVPGKAVQIGYRLDSIEWA